MRKYCMSMLAAALFFFAASFSHAEDSAKIQEAYAFATAEGSENGAVFLTIINNSDVPLVINGVKTDRAAHAELHTMIMDGDVMRMRKVESLTVPAHGQLEMSPTSDHVMLLGLTSPLKETEVVEVTLATGSGELSANAPVRAAGTEHDHGHH